MNITTWAAAVAMTAVAAFGQVTVSVTLNAQTERIAWLAWANSPGFALAVVSAANAGATSLEVQGAVPAPPFNMAFMSAQGQLEIIRVTAKSSTVPGIITLAVVRARQGTTAQAVPANARLYVPSTPNAEAFLRQLARSAIIGVLKEHTDAAISARSATVQVEADLQ